MAKRSTKRRASRSSEPKVPKGLRNYVSGPMPAVDKGGRPRKLTADEKTLLVVRAIAAIGGTHAECAARLGVSEPTWLDFRKSNPIVVETWEMGAAEMPLSLRSHQFALSRKSSSMAQFLGVNVLSQKPLSQGNTSNSNTVNIGSTANADAVIERIFGRIAELAAARSEGSGAERVIDNRAPDTSVRMEILGATEPATAEADGTQRAAVEHVADAGGSGIRKD